jgi:ABC-2 type transport system permease protein
MTDTARSTSPSSSPTPTESQSPATAVDEDRSRLRPIGTLPDDTGILSQMIRVWHYRDLLLNLTKREVKSRHKNSVLGVAWNLLNPLLQMFIYTVVFTYFMPGRTPMFPLKLLSGMAIFGLFTTSVTAGASSIVGNSAVVTKIWFPREILPVAAVASNLVTFASRVTILVVALIIYWHAPDWKDMWLALFAVFVTLVLSAGFGVLLSALNVFFRDIQHFLELALLALFWFTPVVWNYSFLGNYVINRFGPEWERLIMLNPLVPVVTTFERVLYNPTGFPPEQQQQFDLLIRPAEWYFQNLLLSLAVGVVALVVGLRVFARLEGSFAEQL